MVVGLKLPLNPRLTAALTITLTNPAQLFLFSTAVSFYVSAFDRIPNVFELAGYLVSVQIGIAVWLLILIRLFSGIGKKPAVQTRLRKHLETVSGSILIVFAIYLFVKEGKALFILTVGCR